MIQPDKVCDATMEYAAQRIEEVNLLDMRGVLAEGKRAREDAHLRMTAREELRREMAAHLRAMKGRQDLSAIAVLDRIAARGACGCMLDAWPLAFKGWLDIYATVRCNSNVVPPETEYRVELTQKGRRALDLYRASRTAA